MSELLPPPDTSRHDRVWARVEENLERAERPRRWKPAVGVVALAAAAAAAIVFWPQPASWEGAELETTGVAQQLKLGDGSIVVLAPSSRLTVCARGPTCLNVTRGEAEFKVKPQSKGPFRVLAGDVEVRVVGTRFTVKKAGDGARDSSVEVGVTEGRVDVLVADVRVATLTPGQRWSTSLVHTDVAPTQVDAGVVTPPVEAEAAPPSVIPAKPRVEPSADERWNAALSARLSGNAAEEAAGYQQLLSRYPRDRRAGLAAFELARLQLDVQHDSSGAIRMLEVALAKGPTAAYVEDALMRLARAKADTGDDAGCRATRERYLRDFPRGVHTATVRRLCP